MYCRSVSDLIASSLHKFLTVVGVLRLACRAGHKKACKAARKGRATLPASDGGAPGTPAVVTMTKGRAPLPASEGGAPGTPAASTMTKERAPLPFNQGVAPGTPAAVTMTACGAALRDGDAAAPPSRIACDQCGASGLEMLVCLGCHQAGYCCMACQRAAWWVWLVVFCCPNAFSNGSFIQK